MENQNPSFLALPVQPVYLSDLVHIHYGKRLDETLRMSFSTHTHTVPVYGAGSVIGYTTTPLCTKESIILGRVGTIGKPRYIPQNTPFWALDSTFYLTVKNEDKIYLKYLYYKLQTINFDTLAECTVIPVLTKRRLSQLILGFEAV